MLDKNFKEFLGLLDKHKVDYVLVGGYAVGMHGFVRHTGDIDFFIRVSPNNAKKIHKVFIEFGFTDIKESSEFEEYGMIFRIGNPPKRIEVLTQISGVLFETAWNNRIETVLDGIKVNLISKRDLLRNKLASGRSKDLIDYSELTSSETVVVKKVSKARKKK